MSRTTIKAVWPGEKAEDLEELQNSWGSAPPVWDALGKRWMHLPYSMPMTQSEWSALWALYADERLPMHQRAVLTMTFDRAYVLRKDYARAAADIRAFFADFPVPSGHANHWPRIIELFESNPAIPAIGFRWTSVSNDLFWGEWDDAIEDYKPLDWSRFWSVYDELDGVDTTPAAAEESLRAAKEAACKP